MERRSRDSQPDPHTAHHLNKKHAIQQVATHLSFLCGGDRQEAEFDEQTLHEGVIMFFESPAMTKPWRCAFAQGTRLEAVSEFLDRVSSSLYEGDTWKIIIEERELTTVVTRDSCVTDFCAHPPGDHRAIFFREHPESGTHTFSMRLMAMLENVRLQLKDYIGKEGVLTQPCSLYLGEGRIVEFFPEDSVNSIRSTIVTALRQGKKPEKWEPVVLREWPAVRSALDIEGMPDMAWESPTDLDLYAESVCHAHAEGVHIENPVLTVLVSLAQLGKPLPKLALNRCFLPMLIERESDPHDPLAHTIVHCMEQCEEFKKWANEFCAVASEPYEHILVELLSSKESVVRSYAGAAIGRIHRHET